MPQQNERKRIRSLPLAREYKGWRCELIDHERWLRVQHYPIETAETLFIAYDVTTVQKQKEALVENQQKLLAFTTLACDWYWELDEKLAYL